MNLLNKIFISDISAITSFLLSIPFNLFLSIFNSKLSFNVLNKESFIIIFGFFDFNVKFFFMKS